MVNFPDEPSFGGKNLGAWLRRLDVAASENDCEAAQNAIRTIGKTAIPFLLDGLQKGGRYAQRAAAAFHVLGEEAVSAIGDIERNPGPDPTFSGYALAGIGITALGSTISFLKHPEPMVRSAGAEAIANLMINKCLSEEQKRSCLHELLSNLNDAHPHVRARTASAIGLMGIEPARCVPQLMQLLDVRDNLSLCSVVQALGNFGEYALPAQPRILGFLKNGSGSLRQFCIGVLGRIGGQESFEAIVEAINDSDFSARSEAINGLGQFPERISKSLPILLQVLETGSSIEKWNALNAIRDLGPLAKKALPVVNRLLANPNDAGGEPSILATIKAINI